jgi:hypothetical protein
MYVEEIVRIKALHVQVRRWRFRVRLTGTGLIQVSLIRSWASRTVNLTHVS